MYFDATICMGASCASLYPNGKASKWNEEKWTDDKILQLADDGDTGYLFESI